MAGFLFGVSVGVVSTVLIGGFLDGTERRCETCHQPVTVCKGHNHLIG